MPERHIVSHLLSCPARELPFDSGRGENEIWLSCLNSPKDEQFYGWKLEHIDFLIDSCCFLLSERIKCSAQCSNKKHSNKCDRCAIEEHEQRVCRRLPSVDDSACTPLILKGHDREVIEFPATSSKINSPQPPRRRKAILENTTQYHCNNIAPAHAPKQEFTPKKGRASNCQTVEVSGSRKEKEQHTGFTILASYSSGFFKNPRYPAACISGIVCICVCVNV